MEVLDPGFGEGFALEEGSGGADQIGEDVEQLVEADQFEDVADVACDREQGEVAVEVCVEVGERAEGDGGDVAGATQVGEDVLAAVGVEGFEGVADGLDGLGVEVGGCEEECDEAGVGGGLECEGAAGERGVEEGFGEGGERAEGVGVLEGGGELDVGGGEEAELEAELEQGVGWGVGAGEGGEEGGGEGGVVGLGPASAELLEVGVAHGGGGFGLRRGRGGATVPRRVGARIPT